MLMGQQERCARIIGYECKPLLRIHRVDRNIGCACLEHAKHRHDHVQRAFEAHRNQRACVDAKLAQMVRQAVRPRIQVAVGQFDFAKSQRDGLGRTRCLNLKTMMHEYWRGSPAREMSATGSEIAPVLRR